MTLRSAEEVVCAALQGETASKLALADKQLHSMNGKLQTIGQQLLQEQQKSTHMQRQVRNNA